MSPFLKTFLDIVLWRRGPQDLPSSSLLLWLSAIAYVTVSAIQLALLRESGPVWLVFMVVDPLLLTGSVWLILRLHGHVDRFLQTAAAVLGTGALMGIALYLPLQLLLEFLGQGPKSALSMFFALVLLTAFALVNGRILKLGTDSNLLTGVAVSLTYFLLINLLLGLAQGGGN